MDRKTFIQALLWGMVAFLIWTFVAQRFFPSPTSRDSEPGAPATRPATTQAAADKEAELTQPSAPATAGGRYRAVGAESVETVTLGRPGPGDENPFRMFLELSARGASVSSAILTDYAAAVDKPDRYQLLKPVPASGVQPALLSMALENVNIDEQDVPVADAVWRVSTSANDESESAAFEIDVVDETDTPIARIRRVFRLPRQPADRDRHDLWIDLTIENLTERPFDDVRVTERGPVGIHQEYSRAEDRYTYAAMTPQEAPSTVTLESQTFSKVGGAHDRRVILYKRETPERFLWAGAGNKYFCCVMVPRDADGHEQPGFVDQAEAVDLDGVASTLDDVTSRTVSRVRVPAGGRWASSLQCYVGPLDKHAFTHEGNEDYVRLGFRRIIVLGYGWCAFGWLTDVMVAFLDLLYAVIPNFGVAIIIMVLIVRAALHPVTKKGQVNMVRMQERMGRIQPKMEQLKERFGNDRARLQQEQLKLYQEEGIHPATSMFSSCLPMVIQMPIWVALYTSLSNNIAMRHEPFLLWIRDLTAPDELIRFSETYDIPLLSKLMGPISALNLLPILLVITMYAQQKLMPKPQPPKTTAKPGAAPQFDQAAQMQKMMPIMSVFFGLILYAMPSGLNLYIMASTLFGTIEQWLIRRHIKTVKEKAATVQYTDRARPQKTAKPSWLMRKLHELQKQAQDAQRVGSARNKKR